MKIQIFPFLFLIIIASSCESPKTAQQSSIKVKDGWKLIWSEEFDMDGLPNSKNWSYDVGDACDKPMGCGWGNNELQYYTDKNPENARVKDGFLTIEAHKKRKQNSQYTSARLVSKNKADFKYGRMEIRANIPDGLGTWSAIWMMPTESKYGGWPRSGEIDIMEHVGFAKDTIYGTPHTQAFNGMIGTQKEGSVQILDAENNFHTYAVEWTADKIDWFVDDQLYQTFVNTKNGTDEWPFDQKFHFILNLAVGGNWGGRHGVADDIWPRKMVVDYVRVMEKS